MNGDLDNSQIGSEVGLPLGNNNNEVIWFKGNSRLNVPSIVAQNELITQLYDTLDLRSKTFGNLSILINSNQVEERFDYSFFGKTYNRVTPAGINTPEVLLIKAECETRLGNTSAAVNALNTLRINRYSAGNFSPITITVQNELLDFVKQERRRELIGQPQRLFDLKRYNLFDNANITLRRTYNGTTYTLPPNSLNWALPIAKKYLLLNPEIIQNPRD